MTYTRPFERSPVSQELSLLTAAEEATSGNISLNMKRRLKIREHWVLTKGRVRRGPRKYLLDRWELELRKCRDQPDQVATKTKTATAAAKVVAAVRAATPATAAVATGSGAADSRHERQQLTQPGPHHGKEEEWSAVSAGKCALRFIRSPSWRRRNDLNVILIQSIAVKLRSVGTTLTAIKNKRGQ